MAIVFRTSVPSMASLAIVITKRSMTGFYCVVAIDAGGGSHKF